MSGGLPFARIGPYIEKGYEDISHTKKNREAWSSFLVDISKASSVCVFCLKEFKLDTRSGCAMSSAMSKHVRLECKKGQADALHSEVVVKEEPMSSAASSPLKISMAKTDGPSSDTPNSPRKENISINVKCSGNWPGSPRRPKKRPAWWSDYTGEVTMTSHCSDSDLFSSVNRTSMGYQDSGRLH